MITGHKFKHQVMQSAMQSSLAKNIYPNECWHKSGFTIQTRTNEYMEQLPRFMTPNISLVIRRQNSLQRFLPQIQKPSQALQNIQYWEKWKICDSRWLIKVSPILTNQEDVKNVDKQNDSSICLDHLSPNTFLPTPKDPFSLLVFLHFSCKSTG